MAQTGNWNGYVFKVSSKLIRSFEEMKLKGSCETEDKISNNQKYAVRKNGNVMELSFNITISALLGVTNVRNEAINMVKSANNGETAYFYYGSEKLVPAKMMLTSAEVTDITPMPSKPDKWIECKLAVTFKQGSNEGAETPVRQSVRSVGTRPSGRTTPQRTAAETALTITGIIVGVVSLIDRARQACGLNSGGTSAGLGHQEGVIRRAQENPNSASKIQATTGRAQTMAGAKSTVKNLRVTQ